MSWSCNSAARFHCSECGARITNAYLDYEEGTEFIERNADGDICVDYKGPDIPKITLEPCGHHGGYFFLSPEANEQAGLDFLDRLDDEDAQKRQPIRLDRTDEW